MILEDCALDKITSAARNPANPGIYPFTAPLWHEMDFVPGRIQTQTKLWAEIILEDHPDKNRLLG